MYIQSFYKLLSVASSLKGEHTMAVVRADDEDVLDAVVDAQEAHMARSILIGDTAKIQRILEKHRIDWRDYTILQEDNDVRAAKLGVQLVRQGKADILMKGLIGTSTLMREVVSPERGIRTGALLSHLMFYEPAGYKLLCVTDGGINTFPDLEKKKQILAHAAQVFQKFNHDHITAACICGAETVNPKIASTVDAQALSAMNDHWQRMYHMTVYGPVGLDLAISKAAVAHKHYPAAYAGDADILLVPNYEVGNAIGKAMSVFAHARNAGVVVGARAPIALVSRSDSVESRLNSIALCCLLAEQEPTQPEQNV